MLEGFFLIMRRRNQLPLVDGGIRYKGGDNPVTSSAGSEVATVRRVMHGPKRAPSVQPFYRATLIVRRCGDVSPHRSLNHFVCNTHKSRRYRDAKQLGSLEIYHKVEFGRFCNR